MQGSDQIGECRGDAQGDAGRKEKSELDTPASAIY